MGEPPGSVGWPVLGDQSMEFNANPLAFVESRIQQYKSRVFAGRLMNKPTVFVCSNRGVDQVLSDNSGAFEMDYRDVLEPTYDHNVLYTNGVEAITYRTRLRQLFTEEALQSYRTAIQSIAARKPLSLYSFFKEVATEITLTLSLGLDFASQSEEAEKVVKSTVKHWHGLTSIPVSLKIPGTSYESHFCKAMVAKKELVAVIGRQRHQAHCGFLPGLQSEDEGFVHNHLLLFSSALLPKALASLLTTFTIEMARPDTAPWQSELLKDSELMSNVWREVQRLNPPFIVGRRLATTDVEVDGYRVCAGYCVMYVTHAAHRDPAVFADPDLFLPQRWAADGGLSDANLFVFGHGPRVCLAKQLTNDILNTVMTQLLSCYHWTLPEGQNTSLKLLPVSRPREAVHVHLVPPRPHTALEESSGESSIGSEASAESVTSLDTVASGADVLQP